MFLVRGIRSTRQYDPILGRFYEATDEPIDLLTYPSASPYTLSAKGSRDYSSEYAQNHTQTLDSTHYEAEHRPNLNKINLLDIMLGMKCNYRCKYCLQNEQRESVEFEPKAFAESLRKSHIDFRRIRSVRIWGGEPLVYWKRFVELVKLLRIDFDYRGKIWTISNGSLFNQEKCSFCLEHQVAVMFSHDGTAQKVLRNERDYLDDLNIREAVKRQLMTGLRHLDYRKNFSTTGGILMVLGPYNTDIKASIDYVEKRLFPDFPSKIATVFKADKRSADILNAYGKEGLQTLKKNLLEGMRLDPSDRYYCYFYNMRRFRDTVIRHLIYGLPFATFRGRCPSYLSAERLAFDTQGRIMVCYADSPLSPHNHGTIDDLANCRWDLKSIHDRKLCRDCPYVAACMGGCPMLDDENHEIRCRSMMPYNQALFESAYEILFNDRIEEIIKL